MARNRRKKKPNRFLKALPYICIILVALGLIAAVLIVTGKKNNKDKDVIPTLMEVEKTTETVPDNKHSFKKNENSQISDLVQRYFDAINDCDVSELNQIVDQDKPSDKESLELQKQYTDGYSDISCYTVDGSEPDTYIVYVVYHIKYIGIETPVPAMVRLYICQNENGSLYIDNRAKDEDVNNYIKQISQWEEVVELKNTVNDDFKKACASDDKLKSFVDRLNGVETESTEAEAETETAEEESEQNTNEEI